MNPPTSLHPTDQTLSAFGLGKLDEESAESVNRHLEECDDCQRRVAGMSGDSFLGRLQKVHGSSAIPGGRLTSAAVASPKVAPPPADTLPPGLAEHPDYEIKRELGRGGMGVVYLAHNKLMGRDEVLKVMSKHLIERPGVLDRFLREIRSVARLRHPNIVTAYSANRIGESIVFAMEYVDGLDLSRMVKAKGPLPVAHACLFVHQAALGLQHAHEEGLVHRDIKPHNLMLSRKGEKPVVKVLDFGLAKVAREEKVDTGLTSQGQALGTPDYIAPEQILDAQSADIRADIYSLGVTLYYLLTGHPPFKANSLYDLYQAHISRDADPLNLVRPEVPSELASLVAKMMAKEPRRRFQTPGEVALALTRFFKSATNTGTGSSPEIPRVGQAQAPAAPVRDQSAGSKSVPSRPAPVAPSKANANPEGVAWQSLIEFKETEEAEEAAAPLPRVGSGSSRRPPWKSRTTLGAAGFAALVFGIIIYINIKKNNVSVSVNTTGTEKVSVTVPLSKTSQPRSSEPPTDGSVSETPKSITNSIGMKLVLIPSGEFLMGAPDSDKDIRPDEKPQHVVRITRPFYLGTTEVTVGEFRGFVEKTGYRTEAEKDGKGGRAWNPATATWDKDPKYIWRNPGVPQTDEHPVVHVTWNDALAFCDYLSVLDGLKPFDHLNARGPWDGEGYRLPTEAEWEYTCRAGNATTYSFGDDASRLGEFAWSHGNSELKTHPVAQKRPNAWGLYDLHGNVWEWCWDWYEGDYHKKPIGADPLSLSHAVGPVSRGGSWASDPQSCRSALRHWRAPELRASDVGFRVVRVSTSAPGQEKASSTQAGLMQGQSDSNYTFDRKSFTIDGGRWIVQGGELIQTDDRVAAACLMFGDDRWTDYDVTVDLMSVHGNLPVYLMVRAADKANNVVFTNSSWGRTLSRLLVKQNGEIRLSQQAPHSFESLKWYTARIRVRGSEGVATLLDGAKEVANFKFNQSLHPKGRVGLWTSSSAYRFKNIKVTAPDGGILWEGPPAIDSLNPLVPVPAAGFTPLFNGNDLTGWSSGKWSLDAWHVEDGVLIGSGPKYSVLYSDRDDFRDFHLKAEVRVNDKGNSGILFRVPEGATWDKQYEATIGGDHGGLYVRSNYSPRRPLASIPAGRWFTLEVIAEGKHITTRVDGKTVVDHLDKGNSSPQGRIALELAGEPRTRVEFRRIEVKDLKSKDD